VRIAFLNPSGELGGAETALLDLLVSLRTVRPDWTLNLIASAEGPLLARAAELKVASTPLTFPRSLARLGEWGRRRTASGRMRLGAEIGAAAMPTVRYAARLKRVLAEINPDIVHTNGLKMHLLGARLHAPHARVVWHLHDYPAARPLTAKLLLREAHRCAAILANSDSVASEAREMFGSWPRVHTLYNAVDLARFSPRGPMLDLDALAHVSPGVPGTLRIGLVATFARWKGHDVFLDAVARLRARHRVRAYVIGAPIYTTTGSQFTLDELKQLARARGIEESVVFTGRVNDVAPALRRLDIVVHASVEPEPFGLVIAEAMACGRPQVVSRGGGAAEIADGALFHTPGHAQELADRIDQLADDAELRASLGRTGRDTAVRLFSRERLADTLIPVYESLVARGRTFESTARS
jgi:glycosyltransferase involved in cell wall biosynthesis